jgi:hypothetical protein
MTVEIFADGIGSVGIVGDTVRLQFVAMTGKGGSGYEPRGLVVVPFAHLDSMIATLTKARRSRLAATDPGETTE